MRLNKTDPPMPNIESNLYFQTHLTSRAFQILQLAIDFINVATDVVVVNIVVVDWRRFDKLIEKKFFLISFDVWQNFDLRKLHLPRAKNRKRKYCGSWFNFSNSSSSIKPSIKVSLPFIAI